MQDYPHPTQATAPKVDARIDHTAVTFATNDGLFSLHRLCDVDLTDLCKKYRAGKTPGDVFERYRGRQICHHGPGLFAEDVKGRQHQRVILTDWHALL